LYLLFAFKIYLISFIDTVVWRQCW